MSPLLHIVQTTYPICFSTPREKLFKLSFPLLPLGLFLDFKSDYESLEVVASITRMEILLGSGAYEISLSNLFDYRQEFLPKSFLVLTQMLLEPLKFKFIEQSILKIIRIDGTFYPDLAMLSLKNNSVKLSSQIQALILLQGLFGTTIDLYEIIRMDSIHYPIIKTNIALMLYHCEADETNTIIRMLGVVSDSDSCYVGRLRCTTCIIGQKGLCVDSIPIVLNPCGRQVNQKWQFRSDGTIRGVEKCLTFDSSNSLVISDCNKVEASTTK